MKKSPGYRERSKPSGHPAEHLMVASRDEILALPARKVRAMIQDLRVHQIELELQNEELRQAQLALAESRDRYSDLYEFAPIGYVTLDRQKRIIESNFAAASMLGMERMHLIGRDLSRFVVRESRDSCYLHLQAAFDSLTKQVCELNMCAKTGTALVVRLESIAEEFAAGKDVRCRTALIDVTEARIAQEQLQKFNRELELRINLATADLRRRTEQLAEQSAELARSENHFRALVNNVPALFSYVDEDQRYQYVNHQYVEYCGRPASEIVGRTVADLLGPKNFENIRHHIQAALRGEEAVYEVEMDFPDGPRTMQVRNMPDRNEKGHVRGVFTLATDITPRKRAEEALREREERLRAVLNTATDGIVTTDQHGIIMAANPALERMFGYNPGELIGRNVTILMPPPCHDKADEKIKPSLEAADAAVIGSRSETSGLRKDGSIFPLDLAVSKIEQFGLFTGIVRDITSRKEAEAKLEQYRKNLQIASSELILAEERERRRLAEDLHDNLGQAVFRAIMTLDHPPFDDRTVREVRDILVEISNVVSTLTYKLSPVILRQVGLWPALRWLARDLKQRYGLQMRLKGRDRDVPLEDRVSTVLFRSIREMLINVAKHAQTGFATVSIRETSQKLVVSIRDRGKGFDADDKSHQTLGGHFGLFSVREGLEYIGGSLKIRSAPGAGTTVTLTVPLKV